MYVPELCVRAVKSPATLCVYEGSYEPSLFSTKLSWASPFPFYLYNCNNIYMVRLQPKRLVYYCDSI